MTPTFALQPPPRTPLVEKINGPGNHEEFWVSNTWNTWFALLQRTQVGNQLISVLDYGADPSGVTDSTAAFVAAMAYAVSSGRLAVYVPGGDYLVSGIEIPANLMLWGDGEASKILRNATITGGVGLIDMPNANSVLFRIHIDGQVTTPTGLEYGSGTSGARFNNDPMNAKLTDNTSVWIHPDANDCKVIECIIRHTGGYAVVVDYRTDDLQGVEVSRNLLEQNRPHTFGVTAGAYDYGSWTGGIHYQGDGTAGNEFTLKNAMFCENRIYRTTGTGIWGHSYGFGAQASNIVIANNVLMCVGLHGVQFGNVTGGVVSGNTLRQGGVITLTDTDTPVPKYLASVPAYASGIDMAGFVQYAAITGNSVMNWNGDCFDLDGLRDATVSGNSCTLSQSGEPAYTEDDVANFGTGSGPIVYGMQTGNTSLNGGGARIIFNGNEYRGMTAGAIRLYAAKQCVIHSNSIWHPAAPLVVPIIIGNVGSTTETRSASCSTWNNTIYYDPSSIGPAIFEDETYGTFSGTEPNYYGINTLVGNCYGPKIGATSNSLTKVYFASSSSSITTRQQFELQNVGTGISGALKGYSTEGVTTRQKFQIANYRDGSNRDSVLNVSEDGAAATGIVTTGDRTTFGFGDVMAQGFVLNYGYMAVLDKDNAASVYTAAKANLLNDDWWLLRFDKSVGYPEQSITTSAGARVWTPFGGGGSVLPFTLSVGPPGRAGLNQTSPQAALDIISEESVGSIDVYFRKEASFFLFSGNVASSGGADHAPFFIFQRSRDTFASPDAVTSGDQLGGFAFRGYDGSAFVQGAIVSARVESSVSVGVVPMYLSFQTGNGTNYERVRITSGGDMNWYDNSGVAKMVWSRSGQSLTVTAASSSVAGIICGTGFIQSDEGFLATGASATAYNSIQAPGGGVAALGLIAIDYINIGARSSAPSALSGDSFACYMWYDSPNVTMQLNRSLTCAGVLCGSNGIGAGAFNPWNGSGYDTGATGTITIASTTSVTVKGGVITGWT